MSKDRIRDKIKEITKLFVATCRRTIEVFSKHEMYVYSGYTTFYFLMSFVPLLMMIISIINLIPWFSILDISALFTKLIPDIPEIRSVLIDMILRVNRQSGQLVTYALAITSLWSGSHGVNAMMEGLEKINHTQQGALKKRPKAILYTILFTLLIPSMLLFQILRSFIRDIVIHIFDRLSLPEVAVYINKVLRLSGLLTIAAMALIIVLTFTFLPSGKRSVKQQLPGSVFTSILWVLFTNAFSLFIRRLWKLSSVYGSLAAIFLTAMWMKFIVTILFYGASLNRALQVKVSKDCST